MEWSELEGLHDGETLWVLGSGPSLNYIDGAFFDDKVIVSSNYSAQAFGVVPAYAFTHYHHEALKLTSETGLVVTIQKDTLTHKPWQNEQPDNLLLAETKNQTPVGSSWDPFETHTPEPHQIAYGSSSIHGTMHLAAHLGASTIIMVGADCGTIDDQVNVNNYPAKSHDFSFPVYNRHIIALKHWLKENYGVNIYSLNPFVNLNLEGHTFKGVS